MVVVSQGHIHVMVVIQWAGEGGGDSLGQTEMVAPV